MGQTLPDYGARRNRNASLSVISFDNRQTAVEKQTLTFIPWFSWANRGEGEMRIWVDEA
ncbi:TPA: hypothetical protein PFE31_002442 [Kluyvera ascorbata]|jgi:DUF1680 family protein|nr:hypothetical protein [Kluyvera ascorbata]